MPKKLLSYLTLYGAHALKVFSFLILIPHFTGIFSKDMWGQILTVQALALWLQIVVEYGFNLSATRSMSRVRDDLDALARLVAGVAGAKILLSLASIIISILAVKLLSNFHVLGLLVLWATAFAIMQGFNPVWYFLAREQFGQYALIDFLSRLAYLGLCLFFIRHPDQSVFIFAFGVITAGIANIAGYSLIRRQIPLRWPDLASSLGALRDGWSMFLFVGVTSIYTTLNLVILGFSQTAVTVAAYGTSDRIVRAAGGLLEPLNRIIYARLSNLYHHNMTSALNFLKKAAVLILITGVLIFSVGEFSAPLIIRILAPDYAESIGYLRLLLTFIPLLALNNILGLHIMLPLGLDRQFNTVFLWASVVSVAAMLVVTPVFGAGGMAVITVVTELLACLGMAAYIWRLGVLRPKREEGHA